MSDQVKAPRHSRTAPVVAPVQIDRAETDARPCPRTACVLDGCSATPEWRGLCAAHRQTHRGLAVEEAF